MRQEETEAEYAAFDQLDTHPALPKEGVGDGSGLVFWNTPGKPLLVVGPFGSDDEAAKYALSHLSPAYHGWAVVSHMSPQEALKGAQES